MDRATPGQPPMSTEGFYRRPLPDQLIPFSSPEGRVIFREALANGHMEGYFALSEQFHTQSDPATCGLSTLVVALNALAIDPGRLWKGPWRWYSEELLDCCAPLDVVRGRGLTFGQFNCLARCNGAEVDAHRAEESSLAEFRAALRTSTSSSEGPIAVAAYSRKALGQTGEGHFSPLAGYHEARDLVLVLDVARFKYPPHWVPVSALWEAMQPTDAATGRSRGFVLLRRHEVFGSLLFKVSLTQYPWRAFAEQLLTRLPEAIAAENPAHVDAVIRAFLRHLTPEITSALASYTDDERGDPFAIEHREMITALIQAIRATPLHARVAAALAEPGAEFPAGAQMNRNCQPADAATMLFWVYPDTLFQRLPADLRDAIRELRSLDALPAMVRNEVQNVRTQIETLREFHCAVTTPMTPLSSEPATGT